MVKVLSTAVSLTGIIKLTVGMLMRFSLRTCLVTGLNMCTCQVIGLRQAAQADKRLQASKQRGKK